MTNKEIKKESDKMLEPLNHDEKAFFDKVESVVSSVIKLKLDDGKVVFEGEKNDSKRMIVKLSKMFGGTDYVASVWLINQLGQLDDQLTKSPDYVQQMLHMVKQLEPRDPIEGMLITQMVTTQKLAMDSAKRACLSDQTFEERQANMNHSLKLMRVFTDQISTLNKHRGKGQQKMTVEHVHVNEGGQAIIGNVEGGKDGNSK